MFSSDIILFIINELVGLVYKYYRGDYVEIIFLVIDNIGGLGLRDVNVNLF